MIYNYKIKKIKIDGDIHLFEVTKGNYNVSMKKEASDMMKEIFYHETLDGVYELFNGWKQYGLIFKYTFKF